MSLSLAAPKSIPSDNPGKKKCVCLREGERGKEKGRLIGGESGEERGRKRGKRKG